MNPTHKERKSVIVDINPALDNKLHGTIRSFLQSLEYIESLHHLENTDGFSLILENAIFQKMMSSLRKGASYLSGRDKFELERQIEDISSGIYDLYPLTLINEDKECIDLILGKIFSLDKNDRKCYAGAIGSVNNFFDGLIETYDKKMNLLKQRSSKNEDFSINGNAPAIRCIDVFSLAGELNTRHKPICVFFSGGSPENLSNLSRMTVFINLYTRRFALISKEIAKKYLGSYAIIDDLDDENIGRLLLLWLRGHDLGHFYGEDLLRSNMSELDRPYLILHELKSDILSLYNMRFLADDLLKGDLLIKAYTVSIAEMLRYIRRGRFWSYPDTASAFLTYSYLRDSGSIRFDELTEKFHVDYDRLETDIENLAKEVVDIFALGGAAEADRLLNRWGDVRELGLHDLPDELKVLDDTSIPHYIDFNFMTKDRILLGYG
jgi:hypothetical protein